MKLIFAKLGNPEMCEHHSEHSKGFGWGVAEAMQDYTILGNRGMGKAHSGTSALSETLLSVIWAGSLRAKWLD